ncbi:MAG: hypothetical protein R3C05_10280 [Pirellulaceae bacterium]
MRQKFLMTREIAHLKAFGLAAETMDKGPLEIGDMDVEDEWVNKYFNDSTGSGDLGQDSQGPWNDPSQWEVVDNPAFAEFEEKQRL